jgi:hypothetical protein
VVQFTDPFLCPPIEREALHRDLCEHLANNREQGNKILSKFWQEIDGLQTQSSDFEFQSMRAELDEDFFEMTLQGKLEQEQINFLVDKIFAVNKILLSPQYETLEIDHLSVLDLQTVETISDSLTPLRDRIGDEGNESHILRLIDLFEFAHASHAYILVQRL